MRQYGLRLVVVQYKNGRYEEVESEPWGLVPSFNTLKAARKAIEEIESMYPYPSARTEVAE